MALSYFGDTPINRASIENLPIEKLHEFIEELRTRRLKAYTVYQAAQEAREQKELDNTSALLEKRIDQFAKKLISVDKGLEDLTKYAVEILSCRMALGHDISQN